jgi:hypothetical protein
VIATGLQAKAQGCHQCQQSLQSLTLSASAQELFGAALKKFVLKYHIEIKEAARPAIEAGTSNSAGRRRIRMEVLEQIDRMLA